MTGPEDPGAFWSEQARLVDWIHVPTRVLDSEGRWFPDGTLNTCYNALDRHVIAGHADRTALVHESPLVEREQSLTYAELLEQVAALAGALRSFGVGPGDRVLVHLPLVPELAVSMLACARIGAIHVVVPGDVGVADLAGTLDEVRPSVVVTASSELALRGPRDHKSVLDQALDSADHAPAVCVVVQRADTSATLSEPRDVDWAVAMRAGRTAPAECVEVAATAPLYLLPASGLAGAVTPAVRGHGVHAVSMAWTLGEVFDVHAGEVWRAAPDLAEVVGLSYLVYAPLICGAATVLVEGRQVATPDTGGFWPARFRVEG